MSRRILIIDAIPTRRIVMKVKLGAAQYEADVASDLLEATNLVNSRTYDIIFADAGLETMQGGPKDGAFGFCRDLKRNAATKEVPVVMITDAGPDDEKIAAFEAGFDDVIIRPISERVLLSQLRALMRPRSGADGFNDFAFIDDLPSSRPKPPPIPAQLAIVAATLSRAQQIGAAMSHPPVDGPPPRLIAQTNLGIIALLRKDPNVDAILLAAEPDREEATLTLLSDLRCWEAARGAGLVIALDNADPTYVARAFDMGADNVVSMNTSATELRLRMMRLAAVKQRRDAMKLRVKDGLRMAITDPLTGVYNRRFAVEKLTQIAKSPEDFALLMLDLDHFKKINDLHGHGVGDTVLSTIAQKLNMNLRDSDLLARIGGEEFLIALPGASPAQAVGTAERLRAIIDETRINAPATDLPVRVTMSVGLIHSSGASSDIDALLAKADAALYRAKTDGRNMVSISQAA
ncbi:diguanylate cyclase [Litoreibacter sp.]|nr:diguanylate cyclase [Litoreibacter sp.]